MYYSNRDVRLEEMPTPQIGAGEVLMRVEASGICGTDLLEWYRLHKAPLVLGHEVAGAIAAVGEGVEHHKEGDRICVAHHVPCKTCHYCRSGHHTVCDTLRQTNFDPGGFAEYVRLPRINVEQGIFPLQDDVSFEEATFVEPLACVLRGAGKDWPISSPSRMCLLSAVASPGCSIYNWPGLQEPVTLWLQTSLTTAWRRREGLEQMLPFRLGTTPQPISAMWPTVVWRILWWYVAGRHQP